jgi:hypothetical protein
MLPSESEAVAEKVTSSPVLKLVPLEGLVRVTDGGVLVTVKEAILNTLLALPLESVTAIVQSEYVPGDRGLKVIVLLPTTALVVEDKQLPP